MLQRQLSRLNGRELDPPFGFSLHNFDTDLTENLQLPAFLPFLRAYPLPSNGLGTVNVLHSRPV
jgi:hypothetical protein